MVSTTQPPRGYLAECVRYAKRSKRKPAMPSMAIPTCPCGKIQTLSTTCRCWNCDDAKHSTRTQRSFLQ